MTRTHVLAAVMVFGCACGASDTDDGAHARGVSAPPSIGTTFGSAGKTAGVAGTVAPAITPSGVAGFASPPAASGGTPPAMPAPPSGAAAIGGPAGRPSVPPPSPTQPGAAGKPPAAGSGAAGTAAMPPPPAMTSKDPTIPEVKGMCPSLNSGPINFMGADGQVEAGLMPSTPTAPMLLYWHGTGSSAGEYSFMAAAIAQGVTSQGGVIVSFQGTTGKGDCSPSGTFIFCTGDFEVMDQYVACAVKNRNVDPHRIYTAGCSAGGLMATAMAAQRSQYIAAAAPNSGGFTFPQMFSSMHTPPLMAIHGAPGQDVVGVDFSQSSATACMAFKARGGLAIDCNTGGGHCGGGGLAGDAWKFFMAHPFGVDPEPWKTLPAGISPQCKIQ